MQRKKLKVPQKFIDKYGEGNVKIYSFSKLNSFRNSCSWEYYLSRILYKKGESNAYGILGGYAHDIIQNFYEGKIKKDELYSKWEDCLIDFDTSGVKFSHEEDKNVSMYESYKKDVGAFFQNHNQLPYKLLCEREIWIDLDYKGAVCIGYIDALSKEDDKIVITDWKTSTMYKGQDIIEHQKQLLLYAYYFIQNGYKIEDIKIRWNFLKYTSINCKQWMNITYTDKGKEKTSCVLRKEWISKLKTNIRSSIKEFNPEISNKELKELYDKCELDNNFNSLSKDMKEFVESKYKLSDVIKQVRRGKFGADSTIQTQIKKDLKLANVDDIDIEMLAVKVAQDNSFNCLKDYIDISQYEFDDCYVYGIINDSTINNLLKEMKEDIDGLKLKGRDECNWEREPISDSDSFYCNSLCSMKKHCKYYKDYCDNYNAEHGIQIDCMSDEDILNALDEL